MFFFQEANFDFYVQPQFICCKNLEEYGFEVFEQEATEGELDGERSTDKSQKSTTCQEQSPLEFSPVSATEGRGGGM